MVIFAARSIVNHLVTMYSEVISKHGAVSATVRVSWSNENEAGLELYRPVELEFPKASEAADQG